MLYAPPWGTSRRPAGFNRLHHNECMGVPTHRGTKAERAAEDDRVYQTVLRLAKEGYAPGPTMIAYEISPKMARKDIDRALQRLSKANKVEHQPRLHGWVPVTP